MTDRNCTTQSTPKQAKKRVTDTKSFIDRALEVHGKKYLYDKTSYTTSKEKVVITCLKHGWFYQTPDNHIRRKAGCPSCFGNKKKGSKSFITEAIAVHGDTYDYSKTKYKNAKTKVSIYCKLHGEFEQDAYSHLKGYGCPECSIRRRWSTESFVKESIKVHGGLYNYGNTKYRDSESKVSISCKKHGMFSLIPILHLKGRGCPRCQKESTRKSEDEYISGVTATHRGRYDYSKVDYIGLSGKVRIICKRHGEFEQLASNHLHQSQGCPDCADEDRGWGSAWFESKCIKNNKDGLGCLYIIKCYNHNEVFYKVGITSKSVKERYPKYAMPYSYKVVLEKYANPIEVYNKERGVVRKTRDSRYKPRNKFFGKSECFSSLDGLESILA